MSVIQRDQPAPGFEPKVLVFVCNWCSYAGADKAGAAQIAYPANARLVRLMCSGRMDPQFVLKAFAEGADGVLVLACHLGDCHYKGQNLLAVQRHRLLLRLLRQSGFEEGRCRFSFVSASEAEEFARVVTRMVDDVRQLGPLCRPDEDRLREVHAK